MDSSLTHRFVDVNGVRLHIAEQGQGPLVLLLHGWPESWYSWRHQFGALAAAGYRVVAPDQRGYARTEQPPDVTSYTLLHLVGDVIALIEELGEDQAVVVGQLVLAALLAVDHELGLLGRQHGVHLAVEVHREAIDHQRIGQDDVEDVNRGLEHFGVIIIGESEGMGAGVRLKFTRQE